MSRDPAYYALKELDVPPNPLSEFPKYYPQAAAAERLSGRVRILVLIDEFGVVNETSVIEAHPTGYFEDVTRAAVTPTRFSPGIRNGRPVKSRVVLTFGYAYGETDATIR